VRSPTGSGKTFALAIAIAERLSQRDTGVRSLVLVPTRELAAQVAGAHVRRAGEASSGGGRFDEMRNGPANQAEVDPVGPMDADRLERGRDPALHRVK